MPAPTPPPPSKVIGLVADRTAVDVEVGQSARINVTIDRVGGTAKTVTLRVDPDPKPLEARLEGAVLTSDENGTALFVRLPKPTGNTTETFRFNAIANASDAREESIPIVVTVRDRYTGGQNVSVAPTTQTTPIPGIERCSTSQYGSRGDLWAINAPFYIRGIDVQDMTIRYRMGVYFGDPTQAAVIAWNGTGSVGNVVFLAEVHDPEGRQYLTSAGQRVYASWIPGTAGAPGKGFGSDFTGSPFWGETFVTWNGTEVARRTVSADDARAIYKACFTLAEMRVIKLGTTFVMER